MSDRMNALVRSFMKKFLIIPMAVIEIVLFVLNWIVALLNPALGERFMKWNIRTLPNKDWYS